MPPGVENGKELPLLETSVLDTFEGTDTVIHFYGVYHDRVNPETDNPFCVVDAFSLAHEAERFESPSYNSPCFTIGDVVYSAENLEQVAGQDLSWVGVFLRTLCRVLTITGPFNPKCGVDSHGWIRFD